MLKKSNTTLKQKLSVWKNTAIVSILLSGCTTYNITYQDHTAVADTNIASQETPTYGTNLGGIYYNPNGMYHDNDAYNQEVLYRSKGFVPKEEAGIFLDDKPGDKYVVYKSQVCVKEPFTMLVDGVDSAVVRVRCRQANGNFAYVP